MCCMHQRMYLSNCIGVGSVEEVPAGSDSIKPGLAGRNGSDGLSVAGITCVGVVHARCLVGGDGLIYHEGEQDEEEGGYD